MAYIVFRDGTLVQKVMAWLLVAIFVLFFLRQWLYINDAVLGMLFTITFVIAFASKIWNIIIGIKAPVSEVMEVARDQAESLKQQGIPVTAENVQKAIQEEYAREYGISKKKD